MKTSENPRAEVRKAVGTALITAPLGTVFAIAVVNVGTWGALAAFGLVASVVLGAFFLGG